MKAVIDVIIPAFNEEDAIKFVLRDMPWQLVREVIVVNNNSTDNTAQAAADGGATVLTENTQGYGSACLRGIYHIHDKGQANWPDIVVFLDGDYSDYPEQMQEVVAPIVNDGYDMVIGSRALGQRQKGSMAPQQVFGNWLATSLMRLFYGVRYTDLGPFRAIKWTGLQALKMRDPNYGWTVEMQVKAARQKLKTTEVPVNYRQRVGVSKITGTIKGTFNAGYKILYTIFKYAIGK